MTLTESTASFLSDIFCNQMDLSADRVQNLEWLTIRLESFSEDRKILSAVAAGEERWAVEQQYLKG